MIESETLFEHQKEDIVTPSNGTNNCSGLVVANNDISGEDNNNNNNNAVDNSTPSEISIDDAIDALGYGNFQRIILVAAGFSFSADAMEVGIIAFLSPVLQSEWKLTTGETASMTASVFVGELMGTLIIGPLGDRYGRRPLFLISAFIITFFGLMTAFANTLWVLICTRFMVGVGIGGSIIPFDILAEFIPTKQRGHGLLLLGYFWSAGSMIVPIFALLTFGSGKSWKLFVAICAIPCAIGLVLGFIFVPESPRFLVGKGRTSHAMDVLRSAAVFNNKNGNEVFPSFLKIREEREERSGYLELFQPKWRMITLILFGLWLGMTFAYYGTIFMITKVFTFSNADSVDDDPSSLSFNFWSIFISASSETVGITLVFFTLERYGRDGSSVLFYGLAGIAVAILGMLSLLTTSVGVFTLVAFLARAFQNGASCVTWIVTPEVLSTEIRTTGHAAAYAFGRIGAILAPFLVKDKDSLPLTGLIILIVTFITALLAWQLPETAGIPMGVMGHDGHDEDGNPVDDSDTLRVSLLDGNNTTGNSSQT